MKPTEDTPLRISKWPFYLGDALLVATALSIAILAEWDLSAGEILACVLSVSLGAGLFVLPYLYEYTMRLKENADDVEATFRVISRRFERIESYIDDFDLPSGHGKEEVDFSKVLEPVERRLSSLEARDKQAGEAKAEKQSSIAGRLDEIEKCLEEIQNTSIKPDPAEASIEKASGKRLSKRSNLLHRAIQEKQEPDLPAVSRIIEAVPKDAKKEEPQGHAEDEDAPDVPTGQLEAEADVGLSAEEIPATPVQEAAKPKTEASDAAAQSGGDLFDSPVEPAPTKPRKRRGKNDSVLTVNALIGIGNKPYLRGSGGGLSWDKGLQMDFKSIGKWEWTAPDALESPIEVQVYCNDLDPDENGKHTLEPGAKLEISPKFKS